MDRTARASLFVTRAALALLLPVSLPAQTNATMTFEDATAGTGGTIEIPVVVSFGGSDVCQGYSFGACADPTVVEAIAAIELVPLHIAHFFQVQVTDEGWAVGAAFVHDFPQGIEPGTYEVCRLIGEVTAAAPTTTALDTCVIGAPVPFETVMVFLGQSFVPTVEPGTITIVTGLRRGDTNGDGTLNIADAITLWGMFSPETVAPPITCDDATDANDDGQIDVADVVTILASLFQGGSIPAPLLGCGPDETPDALGCVEAGGC